MREVDSSSILIDDQYQTFAATCVNDTIPEFDLVHQNCIAQWQITESLRNPDYETSMQCNFVEDFLIYDDAITNFADEIFANNHHVRLAATELIFNVLPMPKKHRLYWERINSLCIYAMEDEILLNEDSKQDFWYFVMTRNDIRQGNLVLMDNGNLRAIWKNDQGTHLGLQFLGGNMVQYVIFKQRNSAQQVSRVAGRDTIDGLEQQIRAFYLNSLLYE